MAEQPVVIQLSPDQAVVLFELLARFDEEERLSVADPAEERVLWEVHAQLERTLVAPLDPRYAVLLAAARSRVAGAG